MIDHLSPVPVSLEFRGMRSVSRKLEFPFLFPVLNFFCGSTLNTGGVWKYIRNGFFDLEYPGILSQVMHFLDFKVSRARLEFYRQKPIQEHFNYNGVLFLDSAGFKLLSQESFSSAFWERSEPKKPPKIWRIEAKPENVLQMQLDFGADIISSLDFPILPNLVETEKIERMSRSIENCIQTLRLLIEKQETGEVQKAIQLYLPLHGFDRLSVSWYIKRLLERIQSDSKITRNEGMRFLRGFCIGSLVPIRAKYLNILDILFGVRETLQSLKEDYFDTPMMLHVFGVNGDLVPLLTYLGVHSYDSSSHIAASMHGDYLLPKSGRRVKFSRLKELTCTCPFCKEMDLKVSQNILTSSTSFKRINGKFKSEIYADIALHNFFMSLQTIDYMKKALKEDNYLDFLIKFADRDRGERLRQAIMYVAQRDPALTKAIRKARLKSVEFKQKVKQKVSLILNPTDFRIPSNYSPPNESVLLVLPCSSVKPYSNSRSHQFLTQKIATSLSDSTKVHKVTLSGLFGPVPEEFEKTEPVLSYEYHLVSQDVERIEYIGTRLAEYISRFCDNYTKIVGYATSKAYREAIQLAFEKADTGVLLPQEPSKKGMIQFYSEKNVRELLAIFKG